MMQLFKLELPQDFCQYYNKVQVHDILKFIIITLKIIITFSHTQKKKL